MKHKKGLSQKCAKSTPLLVFFSKGKKGNGIVNKTHISKLVVFKTDYVRLSHMCMRL